MDIRVRMNKHKSKTKSMHKNKQKRSGVFNRLKITKRALIVALVACMVVAGSVPIVRADNLQAKIDQLNAQNAKKKNSVHTLQIQASDYQDAINKLQSQISSLQGAIETNQSKQATIKQKIADDQKKIDYQRKVLGEDLKAMYVDDQMTTIEMLATSKNLSDYLDKEQYREAVQNKVQDTLDEIAKLQQQLKAQEEQVAGLIEAQQSQQSQLDNDRSQKDHLLSLNQNQQKQYNSQIKKNNTEISKLQAEQVARNQALFGSASYGGTGSYPWANAPCPYGASGGATCGNYDWGYPGDPYDPAGWQYRNCTSYAFWRLSQARGITLTAGSFPHVSSGTDENGTFYGPQGGIGFSIPDFRNLGYRVDHSPAGAMLAVEGAGPYGPGTYGHIMYVESSTGSSAYVSQYNYEGTGRYSTMTISSNSGLWFVHPN